VRAKDILQQIHQTVEDGYKEIVLTGVNVGDYGAHTDSNLLSLLKEVVAIDGLYRIRISSIEPNLLTDELLDFWAENEKLCNHWHIPLQSGSDDVLKFMRRRYLTKHYRERAERIAKLVPDAGIGADVIVGFPAETHELFNETKDFISDLPLTYLHVFSYSERPNTATVSMENKVTALEKTNRSKALRLLGIKKKNAYYSTWIQKTSPVLLESNINNGSVSGLTQEYVRVVVKGNSELINTVQNVTITGIENDACIGTITK